MVAFNERQKNCTFALLYPSLLALCGTLLTILLLNQIQYYADDVCS